MRRFSMANNLLYYFNYHHPYTPLSLRKITENPISKANSKLAMA